jgi:hypothetical protein
MTGSTPDGVRTSGSVTGWVVAGSVEIGSLTVVGWEFAQPESIRAARRAARHLYGRITGKTSLVRIVIFYHIIHNNAILSGKKGKLEPA